jgi:SWIM zinc finger
LDAVKKESAEAIKYLEKYHKQLWCRSMFSKTSKCDYVTNNISECFNAWIKDLKDLHVAELANQIRRRIMVMFDRRRKVGMKLTSLILPGVLKQLHVKSRALGRPSMCRGGDTYAEVRGIDLKGNVWTHAVELDKLECTCGEWQLCGQPCGHAIAFICSIRGARLEDYVHEYYSIQRFRTAYAGVIRPITDKSKWVKSNPGFTVCPPKMKRPAERPRNERIPSCL